MASTNRKDAMNEPSFRELRNGDLEYMAPRLRDADKREVLAATGFDPLTALVGAVIHSENTTIGAIDDVPITIFGTTDLKNGGGHGLWLLGTDDMIRHGTAVLRRSRKSIEGLFLLTGATSFSNFTHHTNTVHHRWLQWVGARLLPPTPYGVRGELFNPFVIHREYYHV